MSASASQLRHLERLLAPIASLLESPDVDEIMINGPWRIYVERCGRIETTGLCFESRETLHAAIVGIAQYAGRRVDAYEPVLEVRLPDGSRVEAVLPPAAPDGPLLNIRRFRSNGEARDLVARGTIDAAGRDLLKQLVTERNNILVAGGTGSGKTSLLGALAGFIPSDQRVVVIEDARELELPHDHVVHLEARPADARGRGEISVRKLFRATLRLRPDRIVVGEIRGAEALELVQAMTSGHGGCLSTLHATTAADALRRLETLCLMSDVELPLWAVRAQVASAIDAVVQIERHADGSRRVSAITRVENDGEGYRLSQLYPGESAAAQPWPRGVTRFAHVTAATEAGQP